MTDDKAMSWFFIMMCFGIMIMGTTALMPPEPWVVTFTLFPIAGMIISFIKFVKETLK